MTYASANIDTCAACRNLAATTDNYGTHANLCSTTTDTLDSDDNLSTAAAIQEG